MLSGKYQTRGGIWCNGLSIVGGLQPEVTTDNDLGSNLSRDNLADKEDKSQNPEVKQEAEDSASCFLYGFAFLVEYSCPFRASRLKLIPYSGYLCNLVHD